MPGPDAIRLKHMLDAAEEALAFAAGHSRADLDAAIAAMMSFKGDGDRPLGITPTLLVVPPALRAAANKTVKVMLAEGGASNANYDAVKVLVTPWLA